jgi:hypothetical protein
MQSAVIARNNLPPCTFRIRGQAPQRDGRPSTNVARDGSSLAITQSSTVSFLLEPFTTAQLSRGQSQRMLATHSYFVRVSS